MNASPDESLISRLVDDDDVGDGWDQFEKQALAEPRLWRDLARAQRDHAALRAEMAAAAAVADRVDLPVATGAGRWRALGSWSGWAAAAVILLAATMQMTLPTGSVPPPGDETALADLSPADTLREYLRKGRERGDVIGEMPSKMLVDVQPDPSGDGYQLLYLRPILEKTSVRDLYELAGQDEAGRPSFVRYQPQGGRVAY
ncbi:MAG: hypothetical protein ACYTGG_06495 [Planctomycetota bacterium]|jgi:hypothetical protein